jgi:hypothetical protein
MSEFVNTGIKLIAQFYDNDENHIRSFQHSFPRIESILIDDTIPNERLLVSNSIEYLAKDGVLRPMIYPASFLSENNNYAKYIGGDGGETIMPCRGITIEMIKNIERTYQLPAENKFIFFDWDRTISVVEGILCPKKDKRFNQYNFKYNEIIKYLIGSEERINSLKSMYQTLISNNTKVFIVTNNKMASEQEDVNRSEFLKLIQEIFPNFPDKHLIASYDYGGNKVTALEATRTLNNGTNLKKLCNTLFQREIGPIQPVSFGGKKSDKVLRKPSKTQVNPSKKDKKKKNVESKKSDKVLSNLVKPSVSPPKKDKKIIKSK